MFRTRSLIFPGGKCTGPAQRGTRGLDRGAWAVGAGRRGGWGGTYSAGDRVCGGGGLAKAASGEEGISHLKRQINYSCPANEQPLGSCNSRCATNSPHPQMLGESY